MAKQKRSRLRRGEARAAWLFLIPSLLGIAILVLVPFGEAIRRSLYNNPGTRFMGLYNYQSVLVNPAFKLAAKNTGKFIAICVPILLIINFILALSVQAMGKRGRTYKTTYLLPMAIPVASVSLLWKVLFADNGLANGVLTWLGAEPVSFLGKDHLHPFSNSLGPNLKSCKTSPEVPERLRPRMVAFPSLSHGPPGCSKAELKPPHSRI